MLSIPAPLADLGMTQDLRSALLKLSASLPAGRRVEEEQVRQRVYLDPAGWQREGEALPHLPTIQQAVWQDRKIRLAYQLLPATRIELVVAPYGLVAKSGIWYVVCAGDSRVRAHRVSDLLDAQIMDETFERQPDFNLVSFWERWCTGHEAAFASFKVSLRVSPGFVPFLRHYFGSQVQAKLDQAGPPDADGWLRLELSFASLGAARERILSFGRGVEVLEPPALRRSVVDYAEQIVDLYAGQGEYPSIG
jgi:predicted DNA-binding transcriptional regulator YafY